MDNYGEPRDLADGTQRPDVSRTQVDGFTITVVEYLDNKLVNAYTEVVFNNMQEIVGRVNLRHAAGMIDHARISIEL